MFATVTAVMTILVLVLPGFTVADLQRRRRASVAAGSDWDLVLRALSYAVILHLCASPWTRSLAAKLAEGNWQQHLGALVLYGVTILVLVPVGLGLLLNEVLLRAERSGTNLRWWHYALGARDARHAWDFIFQRVRDGRWLVLKLKSGRAIAGKLGTRSWASESPAVGGHDLWLQEIWTVDDFGQPGAMIEPPQGMWVARDEIENLFMIEPPAPLRSRHGRQTGAAGKHQRGWLSAHH